MVQLLLVHSLVLVLVRVRLDVVAVRRVPLSASKRWLGVGTGRTISAVRMRIARRRHGAHRPGRCPPCCSIGRTHLAHLVRFLHHLFDIDASGGRHVRERVVAVGVVVCKLGLVVVERLRLWLRWPVDNRGRRQEVGRRRGSLARPPAASSAAAGTAGVAAEYAAKKTPQRQDGYDACEHAHHDDGNSVEVLALVFRRPTERNGVCARHGTARQNKQLTCRSSFAYLRDGSSVQLVFYNKCRLTFVK